MQTIATCAAGRILIICKMLLTVAAKAFQKLFESFFPFAIGWTAFVPPGSLGFSQNSNQKIERQTMTTTQQLEIQFPNAALSKATRRKRRPNQHAGWWFSRMRRETEKPITGANGSLSESRSN
ncbi:MAG: hypothetical protein ACKVJX_15075 [Verrucomicrobiia bacterium]|jgi:hypothetical protein